MQVQGRLICLVFLTISNFAIAGPILPIVGGRSISESCARLLVEEYRNEIQTREFLPVRTELRIHPLSSFDALRTDLQNLQQETDQAQTEIDAQKQKLRDLISEKSAIEDSMGLDARNLDLMSQQGLLTYLLNPGLILERSQLKRDLNNKKQSVQDLMAEIRRQENLIENTNWQQNNSTNRSRLRESKRNWAQEIKQRIRSLAPELLSVEKSNILDLSVFTRTDYELPQDRIEDTWFILGEEYSGTYGDYTTSGAIINSLMKDYEPGVRPVNYHILFHLVKYRIRVFKSEQISIRDGSFYVMSRVYLDRVQIDGVDLRSK